MSALHRVLVDFDRERHARQLPHAAPEPEPEPAPEPEPEPAVDRVAEAVAEALAGAEAAHGRALLDLAERHAADLAEARERWVSEEGAVLAREIGRAGAALEEALAAAAAVALEPVLAAAARVLAVDGLRAAVVDLVAGGTGGRIVVSGPADLVDALRSALPAAGVDPAGLDFTASEAAEVSVNADNSAVETRLAAWAGALRRHLVPDEAPETGDSP